MPYVKINSKWIISTNIRPQTIKSLENVGQHLHDTGFFNDFLHWHPRQRQQNTNKQTNCILWKLKFGTSKTIIGVRKDSEDCDKIFENHMSDKGLISGISRELWKLTKTKQSSQRWVNNLNRYFSCPWLVVLHNQIPDVGHISGQCFRGQVPCTVLPFGESLRNPVMDVSPTPQWSFLMFALLWRCCI